MCSAVIPLCSARVGGLTLCPRGLTSAVNLYIALLEVGSSQHSLQPFVYLHLIC